MAWTLVEPCCGSAAFALHLLGARRALLPYQGSKWRFRHALARRAHRLGFPGAPSRIELSDPGPWGRTWAVLAAPSRVEGLIAQLQAWAAEDPRAVYDRLHGAEVAEDPVVAAAEHLFLQRLSFSGKAVGEQRGRWSSPGFNSSSAYGLPGTERFGPVKPMIPSLIRVLRGLAEHRVPGIELVVHHRPAAPPPGPAPRTLVYLDPPYAGSTAYPNGSLSPEAVRGLASAWHAAGAAVIVSEQRGLPLAAWQREQLYTGRADTSPFRGKQPEWVTFVGAPDAREVPEGPEVVGGSP